MTNTILPQPKKSELVTINGVTLYYEIYGKGKPLLLLHGYTQSSLAWQDYIATYAETYEVYLIDLRGHGKSSVLEGTFSVKDASNDVIALMEYLQLEKVQGIGLSFGGDVLLQVSSLQPSLIESMIIIGANANWDSQDYPSMLQSFTFDNIEQFQWIRQYHSGGDAQIKIIIEQLAHYKIQMTEEEIKRITAKTLLVLGDKAEQIPIPSVVQLHALLQDAHLWVVPNIGHYAHDGHNKASFLKTSKVFLEGEL